MQTHGSGFIFLISYDPLKYRQRYMKEIKDPRMRGGGSSKIRKYILENHKCFVFFSLEYIG